MPLDCDIATFMAAQCSATAIKQVMAARRIQVSTSRPDGTMVSYQQRGLTDVVRASLRYFNSLHYFNTKQEIDHFMTVLQQILSQSRP